MLSPSFFFLLHVAIGSEFVTFGPAKSHSLTCVVQRGADAEWPDDHSLVAQDPTGEKGNTVFSSCFSFFFCFLFFAFSCRGKRRQHKKRSVTRCLQFNSIQFAQEFFLFLFSHPPIFPIFPLFGPLVFERLRGSILFYRIPDRKRARKEKNHAARTVQVPQPIHRNMMLVLQAPAVTTWTGRNTDV